MRQATRDSVANLFEQVFVEKPSALRDALIDGLRAVMDTEGVTPRDVGDWIRADKEPVLAPMPPMPDPSVPIELELRPWQKADYVASPMACMPEGCSSEHEAACAVALRLGEVVGSSMKKGARPLTAKERDFLTSIHKRVTGTPARYITTKQLRWLDTIAVSYGLSPIKTEPFF